MLSLALHTVYPRIDALLNVVGILAIKHRYTIMIGRTHGQEAELETFGKRCLGWHRAIGDCVKAIVSAGNSLNYAKISGALGNYGGGLDEQVEREALNILGLEPFHGATQIMPRYLYAPLAQALCQLVQVIDEIALSIRLGARSGRPIFQEPFKKKQTGSSAMPHKKNPIQCEQVEGMARMARGYLSMILDNVRTWEERAIEQSSVERVAWPDLFHVTLHSLEVITKVLTGLRVYPDNMFREIRDSRGCYASSEVKEFLKKRLAPLGFSAEDTYRIVQLAAWNVFKESKNPWVVEKLLQSLNEADEMLEEGLLLADPAQDVVSIEDWISKGYLEWTDELDIAPEQIEYWNKVLQELFKDQTVQDEWEQCFKPSYLLRHEAVLFKEILGV